jgi:DNA-binding cell septation regulator SpoVG
MPAPDLIVSEVKIRFADTPRNGLIGWASCVLNEGLFLNNIAIFENDDGSFRTRFPTKRGTGDQRYYYFRPINRETKALMDEALLAFLQRP